MFVKRKGSDDLSNIIFNVSASILTKTVTGLDKFAEYEFQMLAITFLGDGPKSSVKVARTKEDGKFKALIGVLLFHINSTVATTVLVSNRYHIN